MRNHTASKANPATAPHSRAGPAGVSASIASAPVWSASSPPAPPHAMRSAIQPTSRCSRPLTTKPRRAPFSTTGLVAAVLAWVRAWALVRDPGVPVMSEA